MLEHKVLYTSDTHGNIKQLKALVEYALEVRPKTVILAGELTPKDESVQSPKYISAQRRFLEQDLPQIVRKLKEKLPETTVFVTLGNDDCAANIDTLEAHPDLYQHIHGKRVKLDDGHDIVGYSFVPVTPFAVKDFEKYDLTIIPDSVRQEYRRILNQCAPYGLRSTPQGWEHVAFSNDDALKDSIQKDLEGGVFTANAGKTVYVFHTPPHGTSLDMIRDPQTWERVHVGSFAVREFIERHQPHVILHGHIHESVDLSGGRFVEQMGSSLAMSAGNDNNASDVAVLLFDLYQPAKVKRLKLSQSFIRRGKVVAKEC